MAQNPADDLPFKVDIDDLSFEEIDIIEGLAEGQGVGTLLNPQYPQGKILPALGYVCARRIGDDRTWGDLMGLKFDELAEIIAKVFPKDEKTTKGLKVPQDRKKKIAEIKKKTPQPATQVDELTPTDETIKPSS